MSNKIILDKSASSRTTQNIIEAKETLSSGEAPKLRNAEVEASGLRFGNVHGIGRVCSDASANANKIKSFLLAFEAYVNSIEDFDYDSASLIRNIKEITEMPMGSSWTAKHDILELRIRDKLLADGWTQTEVNSLMNEFAISLKGLSKSSAYCGDPINMATGNFIYHKEDLTITSAYPLVFARFYNAIDNVETSLGLGWTHSFNIWQKTINGKVQISFEDGHQETYQLNADGSYNSPDDRYNTLEKRDDMLVLTTNDKNEYHFNEVGTIDFIRDPNDNTTKFHYNDSLLIKVENICGAISFSYTSDNLLFEVVDHTGRTVSFKYQNSCLTSAEQPDGAVYQYKYNSERKIQRIINPAGVTAIINEYDSSSRTTSQRMPDGGKLSLCYEDETLSTISIQQNGSQSPTFAIIIRAQLRWCMLIVKRDMVTMDGITELCLQTAMVICFIMPTINMATL